MPPPARFLVPDGTDPDALVDEAARRGVVERDAPRTIRRTVLDTFDWRLHDEGLVLERERSGRRSELVLRAVDGDDGVRVAVTDLPVFVWDLPAGPVRDRLDPVVEMRALGAVAELATERTTGRILDREGKTRVRFLVERTRLAGRGRASGTDVGSVLTVLPLRGYDADAEAVCDVLGDHPALEGGVPDPVIAAIGALDLRPGWYSSKLQVPLDPDETSLAAVRRVLRRLRQTMRDNDAGVRADTDSEFLHDYRVAVRRTRSVLGQAKGVVPADLLDRYVEEWRWLGGVTGPTRDLDVWLLTLPDLEVAVPALLEGGLDRLHQHIRGLQREAHEALVAELDSPRCRDLLAGWDAWLAEPDPEPGDGEPPAPEAFVAVIEVARARIWKAYRRVLRDGRAIGPDTPGPVLHELRKDAKKLRYLLECYASLFPADEMKTIVRELKLVQDVLGTFQDCEVQTDTLTGFGGGLLAAAPRGDRAGTARTLMAMGSLVELIEERRLAARAAFGDRFERFDSAENRARYRRLFRSGS